MSVHSCVILIDRRRSRRNPAGGDLPLIRYTSTVAFRPGSHVSVSDSSPSVIVSTWKDLSTTSNDSEIRLDLDDPIDLTEHLLSPFAVRDFHYQGCHFHSVAHLMCFRYAVLNDLKLLAISVREWSGHLTEFPIVRFVTHNWQAQCRSILKDITVTFVSMTLRSTEHLLTRDPRLLFFAARRSRGDWMTW